MTQEDKELLFKDLCARLPYGVIVVTPKGRGYVCNINLTIFDYELGVNINPIIRDPFSINDVKPYLFPLSSITKKRLEELSEYIDIKNAYVAVDLLNSHHIDYRGLIEKGLAIDATGLNIY